ELGLERRKVVVAQAGGAKTGRFLFQLRPGVVVAHQPVELGLQVDLPSGLARIERIERPLVGPVVRRFHGPSSSWSRRPVSRTPGSGPCHRLRAYASIDCALVSARRYRLGPVEIGRASW